MQVRDNQRSTTMRSKAIVESCVVVLLSALLVGAVSAQQGDAVRFGRDIRPLLSDRCFQCHGPDAGNRKADLRLDLRSAAVAAREHGAAIVPGDPDASLLMQRLCSQDERLRMPPASAHKPALRSHEIELFRRWIAAGAPYEQHWSFVPPRRPPVPAGESHPVDAFLRQAMRAHGAGPSPAADRRTLCRRVFLVLTGLPPTPAELEAFVADEAEDAYERLVDRLLGEEPYVTRHAEHLATLWLDAGRYADTSGIHMDAGRQAYLWRDWLIQALHDDKPFDEFVVEQLAGDLLPDATPQQQVATGFLRNHVTTDEGGAIDAEYLVEYAAERAETVGAVFLGLTVRCARCHEHKFDPFTQEDYYRLFSFFYNNDEPGLYSQSPNAFRALEPYIEVPTEAERRQLADLRGELAAAREELDDVDPRERSGYRSFLAEVGAALNLHWTRPRVLAATSTGGTTLTPLRDGFVLASGENPDRERQTLVLQTGATEQRLLCLEAIRHPSLGEQKLSRTAHGNAVLQYIALDVRPLGSDADWQRVPIRYAMADIEQQNGDFTVGNALRDDGFGWAVDGTRRGGPRTAWFLTDEPFGFVEGTELRVTLAYDSQYARHSLGCVRLSTSRASASGLRRLPVWSSGFSLCGPFVQGSGQAELYDTAFGPENLTSLDRAVQFAGKDFTYRDAFGKGKANVFGNGRGVTYVAQRLWSPDTRTVEVALGSDDGFQLYLDGVQVGERRIDRGVRPDQDRVTVTLTPGPHLLVEKVVNTGGAGGFAIRHVGRAHELRADALLALAPDVVADPERGERLLHAYRSEHSPIYRQRVAHIAKLEQQVQAIEATVPRAMVMKERAEVRPTFVLQRGQYDQPDPERPVARALPAMFGAWPDNAPRNRLGLARWLVSDRNPLFDRVAVNRLWEFVFGTGIVRTSEDFGLQGEWPSHPELLDWLACEFRARGHSVRRMLRLMVTSETFRQQSRRGPAATHDPDNRLLSWFPRRRLTAEVIRDQALYAAGLLVERTGGPSVKPYQPPGLWNEVAMRQSNTRVFRRDRGDALWRRSLYTYWKRACPPPSLLTFDAPTREFCTIRRSLTNTPLQALVLWNDEQFVEAARVLAAEALAAAPDDAGRLEWMFLRTTVRELPHELLAQSLATLHDLQRRYAQDPEAAAALVSVGEASVDAAIRPADLAAMTLLASAFLDLDATVYLN